MLPIIYNMFEILKLASKDSESNIPFCSYGRLRFLSSDWSTFKPFFYICFSKNFHFNLGMALKKQNQLRYLFNRSPNQAYHNSNVFFKFVLIVIITKNAVKYFYNWLSF